MNKRRDFLYRLYVALFIIYLLLPLIVMAGAAFNDNKLPTIVPWKGWTDRWFIDLWNDNRIWYAFRNTILVALAVAVAVQQQHAKTLH